MLGIVNYAANIAKNSCCQHWSKEQQHCRKQKRDEPTDKRAHPDLHENLNKLKRRKCDQLRGGSNGAEGKPEYATTSRWVIFARAGIGNTKLTEDDRVVGARGARNPKSIS